jgi:hypothetical protein
MRVRGCTFDANSHQWREDDSGRIVCDVSPDALIRRATHIGLDMHARASGCNVFSCEENRDAKKAGVFKDSPLAKIIYPAEAVELLLALAKAGVDCVNIDRNGNNFFHSIAQYWQVPLRQKYPKRFKAFQELLALCRERYGLSLFTQNKNGVDSIQKLLTHWNVRTALESAEDVLTEEETNALGTLEQK